MTPTGTEPLSDEVFDFVRKSEAAVVEVGRKWADSISEFVPVEMPLVHDLTRQVLDFLDELLRIQRDFARQMVDQTRKAVAGTGGRAAKRTPAPRAAHKSDKAA